MPEQDYLTRFYGRDWRALGVEFNYQLHQLAFCNRAGLDRCRRLTLDLSEDVHIVHFSAVPKPVNHLLETQYRAMSRQEFLRGVLFPYYKKKLCTHRNTGKSNSKHIQIRIFDATMLFGDEWLEAWDALAERIGDAQLVVDAAIAETTTSITTRKRRPLQCLSKGRGKGRGGRCLFPRIAHRQASAIGSRPTSGSSKSTRVVRRKKKPTTRGGRIHQP